jgi:hypothetical protein
MGMKDNTDDSADGDDVDTDEIYANNFFSFMRNLKWLSEEAEKQCEMNKYDNVAWELKNFFIGASEGILNIPGSNLSDYQKDIVRRLMTDVAAVPDAVINIAVSNSRQEHLRAMSNSCWIPLRKQAKELISLLDAEIKRTNFILWPPKPSLLQN